MLSRVNSIIYSCCYLVLFIAITLNILIFTMDATDLMSVTDDRLLLVKLESIATTEKLYMLSH